MTKKHATACRKEADRRGMARTDSCQQMRRALVTHSTLNLATGARANERTEWQTARCNAPLFGDTASMRGTCDSCAAGWTHPNNYPVTEEC